MSDATDRAPGTPGIPFGLRPGDRDDRLFEERIEPIPLDAPKPVPDEPAPIAPAELPPCVRNFAGKYARDDARRFVKAHGLDGRTFTLIATLFSIHGQALTPAETAALHEEREPEPVMPRQPATPIAWPSCAARQAAEQLRAELDVPGVVGSPTLRDLLRALGVALAGAA